MLGHLDQDVIHDPRDRTGFGVDDVCELPGRPMQQGWERRLAPQRLDGTLLPFVHPRIIPRDGDRVVGRTNCVKRGVLGR